MSTKTYHWRPLQQLFSPPPDKPLALLVLNAPDSQVERTVFDNVWCKAKLKGCADGGTNRLFKLPSSTQNEVQYIPDFISGDFDSVDQKLMEFYKEKGTEIIPTPDQDDTDFTKCLRIVVDKIKKNCLSVESIVAMSAIGGRLDHTLSNVHTLFVISTEMQLPVYIYGQDSMCCLLRPGFNTLDVSTGYEGPWCSLLPIGGASGNVTTTGLKWNLENNSMQFGGLVSTSNELDGSGKVTVETDQPLLWILSFVNEPQNNE